MATLSGVNFSDKGINVGDLRLLQSTQDPNKRALYVQDLEGGNPKQFNVTQDQYAQLQNLGIKASTTFSPFQYLSGSLSNINELANVINPNSYRGGDLESQASSLFNAFKNYAPTVTPNTPTQDLALNPEEQQKQMSLAMGGSANPFTPGSPQNQALGGVTSPQTPIPGAQVATGTQAPQTSLVGQPGAPGVAPAQQPGVVAGQQIQQGASLAAPTPGQPSPTPITDPSQFKMTPQEASGGATGIQQYLARINQARGFTPQQTAGLPAPQGTPQDAANAEIQRQQQVTKVDSALGTAGVAPPSPKEFNDNPLQAFSSLYTSLFQSFGLSSFKDQSDIIAKELKEVDDKMSEQIASVNENPWISEGLRLKKIEAINGKYETQRKTLVDRQALFNTKYEQGLDQVKFLSQTALGAYYSDRALDQNLVFKQMELAQKEVESASSATQQDFENNLALAKYNLDVQKARGEGTELSTKQTQQAIQLANSLKAQPAYIDMIDVYNGIQGVETGLAQGNGFGDITAINAFQRMVDPGATVRSEDVVLLQSASALVQKILSDYPIEKLTKGSKLPDPVRAQMLKVAQDLYQTRAGNYNQSVGTQYKKLAGGAGIDFGYIGTDFPISYGGSAPKTLAPASTPEEKTQALDALLGKQNTSQSAPEITEDSTGFLDRFLNIFGIGD